MGQAGHGLTVSRDGPYTPSFAFRRVGIRMAHRDLGGSNAGAIAPGDRVVLRASGETLRLTGCDILEVVEPAPAIRLPGAPPEVIGIVNHRGSPIPVVDLGRSLGAEPSSRDPDHRVLVFRWRGFDVGLAADDVTAFGGPASSAPSRFLDLDALFEQVF
jgi:hypothetical protein